MLKVPNFWEFVSCPSDIDTSREDMRGQNKSVQQDMTEPWGAVVNNKNKDLA